MCTHTNTGTSKYIHIHAYTCIHVNTHTHPFLETHKQKFKNFLISASCLYLVVKQPQDNGLGAVFPNSILLFQQKLEFHINPFPSLCWSKQLIGFKEEEICFVTLLPRTSALLGGEVGEEHSCVEEGSCSQQEDQRSENNRNQGSVEPSKPNSVSQVLPPYGFIAFPGCATSWRTGFSDSNHQTFSKTLTNLSLLLDDVKEMLSSVCVFIEVSHKSFALILSLGISWSLEDCLSH